MRDSLWTRRPLWPLLIEGMLFLFFLFLLVRLYLGPTRDPEAEVRWWAWLATAPPLLLAAAIEWRRKKRPVFRAADIVRPGGDA